jgi:hypothetical protein
MTTATIEQMDTTATLDVVTQAEAVRIADASSYTQATELLKTIKSFQADIKAYYEPRKSQAKAVHQQYCDDERARLAPLVRAEASLKGALLTYDEAQERLRLAEQRRLEEEARQREETRRLEEAALLEREGNAANDPELLYQANELLTQPIETPLVSIAKTTPKVSGVSYREIWKAECVSLLHLVRHVAEHPEHLNLLQANGTALNQLARAQKSGLKLPGVRVMCEKNVAAGGR